MDTHPDSDAELFISRELSWLDFNSRVLDEAEAHSNPLLERLKFIAITASNLDEFFMVRVAGLRQLARSGNDMPDPAGLRAGEQLVKVRNRLNRFLKRQNELLYEQILPELEKEGVRLCALSELSGEVAENMKDYFFREVMPVLTPFAVDPAHPFPQLNSGAIEIALSFHPYKRDELVHAFVEVPEVLARFVPVPDGKPGKCFVPLEELILGNLKPLFSGAEIVEAFPFRITRDMDFSIEDENSDDLMRTIGKKLLERRQREPIRLELPPDAPRELAAWLKEQFDLEEQFCYSIPGALHRKQFFELAGKANRPELLNMPWNPVEPAGFAGFTSIFDAVKARESLLILLPFHSFSPVLRMLEEAAADPDVLAIKQTLYRVSGNSPVVNALRRAAESGKQVTVVVELKARFDEGNNIAWARALDESGAHLVYGIAGLKVHAKALLVVRREEEGMIRRYCHVATGNYNDKTAALYTDAGLMTCDAGITADVANLFNVLTAYSAPLSSWHQVAVAPFDLRRRFETLIEREIEHAKEGSGGKIIAKMNSLADENMIRLIHRAADAGVEIDLIVRGICCYKPRKGQENCRIVSIVDRYLEHTRLFYFHNQGDPEYFLSSADWMGRNLDRRIELMFPVTDPELRKTLYQLLTFQLEDHCKVRRLQASGVYTRPEGGNGRSQEATWHYLRRKSSDELRGADGATLKVFRR